MYFSFVPIDLLCIFFSVQARNPRQIGHPPQEQTLHLKKIVSISVRVQDHEVFSLCMMWLGIHIRMCTGLFYCAMFFFVYRF